MKIQIYFAQMHLTDTGIVHLYQNLKVSHLQSSHHGIPVPTKIAILLNRRMDVDLSEKEKVKSCLELQK
jgi:hypothetical protein